MEEKQQHPRISVVIPARNEAQNLQHILPKLPEIVTEVILVDGHSTDDTSKIAQQLLPDIRVIQQEGRGKGDAKREALTDDGYGGAAEPGRPCV